MLRHESKQASYLLFVAASGRKAARQGANGWEAGRWKCQNDKLDYILIILLIKD